MAGIDLRYPRKNCVLYQVPTESAGKPAYYGDPKTPNWADPARLPMCRSTVIQTPTQAG